MDPLYLTCIAFKQYNMDKNGSDDFNMDTFWIHWISVWINIDSSYFNMNHFLDSKTLIWIRLWDRD